MPGTAYLVMEHEDGMQHRSLEDGRECRGGRGEGGVRDDARGVVEQRDQVGLAAAPPVFRIAADLRSVQHVAHPELAGVAQGEAVAVLGSDRLGGTHGNSGRNHAVAEQGRVTCKIGIEFIHGFSSRFGATEYRFPSTVADCAGGSNPVLPIPSETQQPDPRLDPERRAASPQPAGKPLEHSRL